MPHGARTLIMKTSEGACRWEEFVPGPAGVCAALLGTPVGQHGQGAARFAVHVSRRRRTQLWRHPDRADFPNACTATGVWW